MGTSQQGRPELIAPAGDMERLETALHFGADAVYLSGKQFSLRSFSKNFTLPELDEAVRCVHAHKKRAYLAANGFVKNRDLPPIRSFLEAVSEMGFDAVEVHGSHGYLIAQFLSPFANSRSDSYGGSLENRARLAVQVIREVRRNVGKDFPIFFRLATYE